MWFGIIFLVVAMSLLIIDGPLSPPANRWRLCRAIGSWLNNRIVRRVLRVLLVVGIVVGSLFIFATIGFLVKNNWLVVLPATIAMVVLSAALISTTALERMAQGFFRLLGFKNFSPILLKELEKSFLGAAFWIYMLLALYPIWNPWTGNPKVFLFLLPFGLGLFAYSRWAALPGKGPKVIAIVIVPLLFFYCLGRQEPDSALGGFAGRIDSFFGLKGAKQGLKAAVENQQTEFFKDAKHRVQNVKECTLKDGVVPLDENAGAMNETGRCRIEATLTQDQLPSALKAYFGAQPNEFYQVRFRDDNDRYSKVSAVGYVETADVKGIIEIPEAPEVKGGRPAASSEVLRIDPGLHAVNFLNVVPAGTKVRVTCSPSGDGLEGRVYNMGMFETFPIGKWYKTKNEGHIYVGPHANAARPNVDRPVWVKLEVK